MGWGDEGWGWWWEVDKADIALGILAHDGEDQKLRRKKGGRVKGRCKIHHYLFYICSFEYLFNVPFGFMPAIAMPPVVYRSPQLAFDRP